MAAKNEQEIAALVRELQIDGPVLEYLLRFRRAQVALDAKDEEMRQMVSRHEREIREIREVAEKAVSRAETDAALANQRADDCLRREAVADARASETMRRYERMRSRVMVAGDAFVEMLRENQDPITSDDVEMEIGKIARKFGANARENA